MFGLHEQFGLRGGGRELVNNRSRMKRFVSGGHKCGLSLLKRCCLPSAVPGEADFAAMLNCLVFGMQPEFTFEGVLYYSPATQPVHPELAAIEGIREVLPRLALFHASLCQASGMGGAAPSLGRIRRERYVFTRRTLLTCLNLLGRARVENPDAPAGPQIRQGIEDAYLGRISDRADRNAAVALLRAAGLSDR